MDRASLVAEITAAFDGVSREEGVTLHQAHVLDWYGTPDEEAAARARDTETRWQDVPEDDIRNTDAVLSYLDPEGFRYYLPAYMLTYLSHFDDAAPGTTGEEEQSILFHLGVGCAATFRNDRYHRPRLAILSPAQTSAVAHFLHYLVEHRKAANTEIEERLQAVWEKIAETGTDAEPSFHQEIQRIHMQWEGPPHELQKALERYWGRFL